MKKRYVVLYFILALLVMPLYSASVGCGSGGGSSSGSSSGSGPEIHHGPDTDGDGIPNDVDPDADGDGFEKDVDCNDMDASIHPGAVDRPDADYVDTNCDGMDGDPAKAVWVSAVEGDDSASGAIDAPVRTIAKALALATADPNNKKDIYIVQGTYAEDVAITDDIGLFGGFGPISDGIRKRDVKQYVSKITGVDNAQTYTFDLPSGGSYTVATTVLVNSANSAIDGVTIVNDNKGVGLMAVDSDLLVTHCILDGATPDASMELAVNVVFLTTSSSATTNNVVFKNNTINMKGGGSADKGSNYGILGMQGKDADGVLNIEIDDNSFFATGKSKSHVAIGVADMDDDPASSGIGDGKADINLTAKNNAISMDVEGSMAVGIWGGMGPELSIVPGQDNLIYINSAIIEGNTVQIQGDIDFNLGFSIGLVRQKASLKGNVLALQPSSEAISVGAFSIIANTDITANTFFIHGKETVGVFFAANDINPICNKYVSQQSPGEVSNNIINLTAEGSGCYSIGLSEEFLDDKGSSTHLASPKSVVNNDIFINAPSCTGNLVYMDRIQVNPANYNNVTGVADLNSKTGFLPDDPTEINGNISQDPMFVDPANGDFHLQAGSPAKGMGAY